MKHPFTLSFISQLKFVSINITLLPLECSEEDDEGGDAGAESLCRGLGLRFGPPPPPLAGQKEEDLFRGVSSRKFETGGGGEFAEKVESSSEKRVLGRLAGRCSADLVVAVAVGAGGGGGGGEGAAAAAVRLVNVVDYVSEWLTVNRWLTVKMKLMVKTVNIFING